MKEISNEILIEKVLNSENLKSLEKRGEIGAHKSYREIQDVFNDEMLDFVLGEWWGDVLEEITNRYIEKYLKRTEENIKEIIYESNANDDIKAYVAEWLVLNTEDVKKIINTSWLNLNGEIIKIYDILLSVHTGGEDILMNIEQFWKYELSGEGAGISNAKIEELIKTVRNMADW